MTPRQLLLLRVPVRLVGLLLLVPLTLCAQQPKYRVALCPGPVDAYKKLVKQVRELPVPTGEEYAQKTKAQYEANEKTLKEHLNEWDKTVRKLGLQRYQVEIRYPNRQVRFWQSDNDNKPGLFNATVSAAVGRGTGLNLVAKPGDNQRCFFQDTTIVLDTLRIRLGDFSPDTRFVLSVGQKTYPLPLSANRTELLVYAGLLPASSAGRYLPATVKIEEESYPVTFYFLSPDDRAQLVRSLRASMDEEPATCRDLPDRLMAYLTRNWGGKQCGSLGLYLSAQRQVIRNLLRTERIACAL